MQHDASPPAPHRGLRRVFGALLALVIAIGGVLLLLVVFQGRDTSQLHDGAGAGGAGPGRTYPDQGHAHLRPGQRPAQPYASNPPTSGPHVPLTIRRDPSGTRLSNDQLLEALELGDVVLLTGGAQPPAALRALAEQLAGPFDSALAAAGEAVVLARRPGTHGVVALAWRHMLRTADPRDPALAQFASYWLGRGVAG